jgi:hypothetical protein
MGHRRYYSSNNWDRLTDWSIEPENPPKPDGAAGLARGGRRSGETRRAQAQRRLDDIRDWLRDHPDGTPGQFMAYIRKWAQTCIDQGGDFTPPYGLALRTVQRDMARIKGDES